LVTKRETLDAQDLVVFVAFARNQYNIVFTSTTNSSIDCLSAINLNDDIF
jgi:hypothetical protein